MPHVRKLQERVKPTSSDSVTLVESIHLFAELLFSSLLSVL